jgi:hypothetical protein
MTDQRNSRMAVPSVTLGVIGLALMVILWSSLPQEEHLGGEEGEMLRVAATFMGVLGLALAFGARRDISDSPNRRGSGMAVAGIVLNLAVVVLAAALIVYLVARGRFPR